MKRTMLMIVVLVAWGFAAPGAVAQDATPDAVPGPTSLLRTIVDDLPPDGVVRAGITRASLAPGSAMDRGTGSGAAVLWVETGTVTLSAVESMATPTIVRGAATDSPGTPLATSTGDATTLMSGDAVVLPSGSLTEIRNDGDEPAALLLLLAAPDATSELDGDVSESVLTGGERMLPGTPVTLAFEQVVLEPAGRLAIAPEPTVSFVAAVARTQNVKLGTSPDGYANRDTIPMPLYVLTLVVDDTAA